ncbi:MAG: hypothetical protein F7C34_03440 [Desulfurococcales archaeon]|nr:hypothetical protein [Desulfurococcales archaeon]
MSEDLYGERSLLSLLIALSRLSSTLARTGATIREALELSALSGDPGIRELLLTAQRALSGDLSGALRVLQESASALEAAARLEEVLESAGREAARALASAAEWAASRLYYFDAAVLYTEAVRTRLEWALTRPLDRLQALRLAAELWPGKASVFGRLEARIRRELCFPRGYCPLEPPMNVEEAKDVYRSAEEAWRVVEAERLPTRDALLERHITRVESPLIEAVARRVIGDIPGMLVVLRHEDLASAESVAVIVYDNTVPGLRRAVEREISLAVPIYRWSGASIESIWYARRGRAVRAAVRDELSAAPIAGIVEAARSVARLMPGSMARMETGDELRVVLPSLGARAVLGGPEAVRRARRVIEEELSALASDEDWREKALARALLRLALAPPHEYGEAADR